uniref:Uncharacterized protein n=1 Tax=Aquila chrysaetos chrysaetos TaxID=223781 RepID=A0A663EG11_AQUCH
MKLNDFFWPYGRIYENSLKLVAVSQTDEDFACIAVHSSKKSRTQLKDPKKEKKEKQKKPHKELTLSQKQTPSKRISLDDKLYQRDLEVALALSVKENSANILDVQNSEEQGKHTESENVHRRPLFSNCSVDSELLGKLFSYSVFSEVVFQDTFK